MATSPSLTEQRVVQGDVILRVSRILNAMEDVLLRLPGATFETSWRPVDRETPPASIKIRIRFRPDLSVKAEFRPDGSADFTIPLCSVRHEGVDDIQGGNYDEVFTRLAYIVTYETARHTKKVAELQHQVCMRVRLPSPIR